MNGSSEFSIKQPYVTNRKNPVLWIFSHTLKQWPIALAAMIGAFGNAGLMAVSQVLIGNGLNAILESPPNIHVLLIISLEIAGAQLIRGGLQFIRNYSFEVIAQRVEREVRDELYISLLGKSMTFHNLQPVGDTMARATNDVREVNYLFSPGINLVIGSINFLIMPILLAPQYHPALLLTPVIFLILYFFFLARYLGAMSPVTDEIRESFGVLNTRLSEALDGIETVKGAAQEKAEIERFSQNAKRYRDASVKQGDMEAQFIPLLLMGIALGAGLFHALLLLRQGYLNVGQVVGYFGLLLMLDFPTYTSTFAYSQISSGLAGARRILELMARETNIDQNSNGFAGSMVGDIEFRNVSFDYGNQNTMLDGISFHVKPGQTVAIVGQTGSGKTTMARLVNRTYDVTSGQVLVDGMDVREWNLEALRKNISIIEQDIFLFSRSISNNIAFGKPSATEGEIQKAAVMAQADEFIQDLSAGYGTHLGERGVTLSGGQRQRLALARAFLTDPRILILDDSTSAIDSATEDRIQKAIYTAAKGRTTFIITHRLSQIRWADLILVMRQGKLTAAGNHDDLMKSSDAYRKLFSE